MADGVKLSEFIVPEKSPITIPEAPEKEEKTQVTDMVCDKCGAALVTRADDKPETVLNRLKTFHDQTEPVKSYYAAKDKLICVVEYGKLSTHSTASRSSHVHHLLATPNHSPTTHQDMANVLIPNNKITYAIGITIKFVKAK